MSTITLTASRGYQDIGTVGQTVAQLAGNVQSINQILDVGLRNTRDYQNSFVRVSDLIGLGLATLINGNQLTSSGAGGTTLTAGDSVVITANKITLVGDTATPSASRYYGTDSSSNLGYHTLPSPGTGTVTSVGISTPGAGVVVGGGPITTAGTLTVDLSSSAYTALALADTALQSISIATGTGLTGGPLTASGSTVSLANTAVTPGSYTYASITVDAQGRLTSASNGTAPGSGTVTSVGYSVNATYIALGGTASPITTTGAFTLDLSTAAKASLALANTAVQPAALVYQFIESAGWNSSSGAVQLSLTVPQDIQIPYGCTLQDVRIQTQGGGGSCTVTLTTSAFPFVSGTDITGGTSPAITSGTSYDNSTLSGWTTAFAQGVMIRATLTANTGFTSVKIMLRFK